MATDANGNEIQAVTFDEKQQEKVNQLIREKQGEAAREVRAQLAAKEAEATTLATELAAAKAALAAAKPGDRKGAAADVEALQLQMAEMKAAGASSLHELDNAKKAADAFKKEALEAKNETLKVRKEVAIQKAASKASFVDLGIVTKLTEDNVKWDEQKGRFAVISETGAERLNSSMEPMTLEELYKEFAGNNPYLVKPDARSGAGSSQNQGLSSNGKYEVADIFGPKGSSIKANNLAKENLKEYQRLKVIAQEAGLIPKPLRA